MKFPRLFAAGVGVVMLGGRCLASARAQSRRPDAAAGAGADAAADQRRDAEGAAGDPPCCSRRLTTPQQQPPPPPQPTTARVTNLTGYVLGRPDAPLTMVEFTDLQCPFCRQFILTSFDEIKKNWIDTGKLRYISRDFPLDFHAQAMPAARAARCAGEQGKFWEMRLGADAQREPADAGLHHQDGRRPEARREVVRGVLRVHEVRRRDPGGDAEGTTLGVGGTPTFVMGKTTATAGRGPDDGRRAALRAVRREAQGCSLGTIRNQVTERKEPSQ